MHLPFRYCRIPQFHPVSRGAMHGSSKSLDDPIMARTLQYLQSPVLLRIHQLLLTLHQPLCGIHPTLTNLCWKNTPWHFGESESTAFQCLKTAFCLAPVL